MPAGVIPASEKEVIIAVNALIDLVQELKDDYNAHVHGSVATVGPVTTGGVSASIAATTPEILNISPV